MKGDMSSNKKNKLSGVQLSKTLLTRAIGTQSENALYFNSFFLIFLANSVTVIVTVSVVQLFFFLKIFHII